MYWAVNQAQQTIEFALTAPVSGWVGIAIDPTAVHVNMDTIVGYVDAGGVAQVNDYWLYDKVAPTLDTSDGGRDSIIAKNGGVRTNFTTLMYNSLLEVRLLSSSLDN